MASRPLARPCLTAFALRDGEGMPAPLCTLASGVAPGVAGDAVPPATTGNGAALHNWPSLQTQGTCECGRLFLFLYISFVLLLFSITARACKPGDAGPGGVGAGWGFSRVLAGLEREPTLWNNAESPFKHRCPQEEGCLPSVPSCDKARCLRPHARVGKCAVLSLAHVHMCHPWSGRPRCTTRCWHCGARLPSP